MSLAGTSVFRRDMRPGHFVAEGGDVLHDVEASSCVFQINLTRTAELLI
jgi:hypothetical protein